MNALIALRGVSRRYGRPATQALVDVDLDIDAGELAVIVGPSGSGKSTLLNLIGTLDRPSRGSVEIAGVDVAKVADRELAAMRAWQFGFVFQQFHLSQGVTTLDNVADGLLYTGTRRADRRARAERALRSVGLGHRLTHFPNELSGGESQRVAIARAIVAEPRVLLADEPTGALDTASGAEVIRILRDLNARGTTVVVISHDRELAAHFPRQIQLRDGRIVGDVRSAGQLLASGGVA